MRIVLVCFVTFAYLACLVRGESSVLERSGRIVGKGKKLFEKPQAIAVDRAAENVDDRVKYYVYTRKNRDEGQIMTADVESVIRNVYNPLKPTTVALHRGEGGYAAPENQEIINAKLEQEDCNVIVADWGTFDMAELELLPSIGEIIANLLILLQRHFDVTLAQIHLVGFGLGAQLAGVVGQSVLAQTGDKVQLITGLDPANVELVAPAQMLSSADAHFVEVIHTNTGALGYAQPCGHADYYPNGGTTQPGCEMDDSCSHERAYELLSEMWSLKNEFVATKCTAYDKMNLESCVWVNVMMGANRLKNGLFYLQTNDIYPYSKGSFVYTYM